ncbi:unnamed protein product [Sphenostylis stenocarpa]|uniref:TIR domain-containing protein n=1 Tax=Sphenostylis stenocarpa TaxID=92480 RepID=A0AA86SSL0_9FABA|nr:unnamed protein product [Sphenostylis stenocarpa]
MGREVVREESIKNPGQRSRLWDPEEVYDVLTNNRGTGAVEGICFCPEKLVEISMSFNNVEKLWQGVQNFRSLEKIELRGSKNLLECPKLSHAPKLKYVSMRDCESLPYVDPSIFSLPKLEILNVSGCKWLKSLCSNIWPQYLRVLFLAHSGLNELPPSILHIRNLHMFSFLINDGLVDLPENFTDQLSLSDSREDECDTFLTLRHLMSSSGFQSDAIGRIELGSKHLSAVELQNEEDASSDIETALVTIELPPNLLGFVFYLVVSKVQSCNIGRYGSIGCECYLETSRDERMNIRSFFVEENILSNHDPPFGFMEDHIFLWYYCKLDLVETWCSRNCGAALLQYKDVQSIGCLCKSMASSNVSCASFSSSQFVPKRHDVFISFRGEDTRSDFTSHLHAALCRNSDMDTYIDYRIQKGDEVWAELVKAIKDSTLFLVIFSENYASSTWCLNELVELMECNKQEDVDVIPVFYKIDPSQVRTQSGSYQKALAKHKKDGKVTKERMQQWKGALCEAANLSGFHSNTYRTESNLIEDIIKVVLQKLNHKYANDFRGPFISDENYTNIESLLKYDSEEVRIIGIWGMGGIRSLLDKALITINSSSNCIDMHDLIQEMGREVVREESIKNPGQRSRLWDPEEVYDVLTNNRGTGAIEGIWLDITQNTNINLSSKAFRKMPNLRLLAFQSSNEDSEIINSLYLPKGLQFLPKNLRYLEWNGYPLKSLPSSFFPEKLVEISMPFSNVEKLWQGVLNFPSLEKIELRGSKNLLECPKLSHAPKLKYVSMRDCESLPYVDQSIFSLPKLETLNVSGCKSLKSLSSNIWPQYLRVLFLAHSGLNELPPSILHIRNLHIFSFLINDDLADLPENFTDQLSLSDSREDECDTFLTLHHLMSSSGFQSVTSLAFYNCQSLCEIPDNISLLSSLKCFSLRYSTIISLPESFKYLPRLKLLEVGNCKMLQHIHALPQSIQLFYVWNCESLQTVLSSTVESSKIPKCSYLLPNCLKLDEHSYDAILKDAIVRIELGSKHLSAVGLQNEEDGSSDNEMGDFYFFQLARNGKICYCLPARNGSVQDWLHYHFTQDLVTIELPPNLLGFIFYLVVSEVQSCNIGRYGSIGCECYLETSRDERMSIPSFFVEENILSNHDPPFGFMEDHIFLWYDAQCCKKIMEVIKEEKAIDDKSNIHHPKVTFKFFAQTEDSSEAMVIKECGFRWMHSLEEGGFEFKKNKDIHGVEEANSFPKVEDSKSNVQEGTFLPTKKIKQQEGTEDLRYVLEELLHIGFGGDIV